VCVCFIRPFQVIGAFYFEVENIRDIRNIALLTRIIVQLIFINNRCLNNGDRPCGGGWALQRLSVGIGITINLPGHPMKVLQHNGGRLLKKWVDPA